MTWKELVIKVLNETDRPLSAREIWKFACNKGYDKFLNSKNLEGAIYTIASLLYEAKKKNNWPDLLNIGENPVRFYLKTSNIKIKQEFLNNINNNKSKNTESKDDNNNKATNEEILDIDSKTLLNLSDNNLIIKHERDLHKYLTYFVYNTSNIYTKTIYHELSDKKKYTQWLHPDMVGVYFPFNHLNDDVINISKVLGNVGIKLYSYELKKELDFSNLRESYFQAVSNSSWANEGYLVTAYINEDDAFLKELKRLNIAFGIGIIKLDIKYPNNSRIILPAKEKEIIDIETINKISECNSDFRDFIKRVKHDFDNKDIIVERYDTIYSIDELQKHFQV